MQEKVFCGLGLSAPAESLLFLEVFCRQRGLWLNLSNILMSTSFRNVSCSSKSQLNLLAFFYLPFLFRHQEQLKQLPENALPVSYA